MLDYRISGRNSLASHSSSTSKRKYELQHHQSNLTKKSRVFNYRYNQDSKALTRIARINSIRMQNKKFTLKSFISFGSPLENGRNSVTWCHIKKIYHELTWTSNSDLFCFKRYKRAKKSSVSTSVSNRIRCVRPFTVYRLSPTTPMINNTINQKFLSGNILMASITTQNPLLQKRSNVVSYFSRTKHRAKRKENIQHNIKHKSMKN